MEVIAADTRATLPGPSEWFTGTVWVDEIAVGIPPSWINMTRVTFAPQTL